MGKINYSLLNASALNASRLNLTGEAGKPGGGGGGYWPEGTPAAIRRSAVLWYDIALQGATNESMAAHPYLLDLTGNGHDMELRNFAWTEESGISTESYPGALVTDGVDDYGYVEGLPLLTKEKGFTVMAVRKWLSEGIVTALASKALNPSAWGGAFTFEGVEGGGTAPFVRIFNGATYLPSFQVSDFSFATSKKYNDSELTKVGDAEDNDKLVLFELSFDGRRGKFVFYKFILFDRDLTDEEIEWVRVNIMDEAEPEPTPELDASLVDAWIFSGYRNEDAPERVAGEKGHALTLRNFAFTEGSGFADGCLVTDGVDDYCSCPDFPLKDTYTMIAKYSCFDFLYNTCGVQSATYIRSSGLKSNGFFLIYRNGNQYRGGFFGRNKYIDLPLELTAVWMNIESYNGESYDINNSYQVEEGQMGVIYIGRLDEDSQTQRSQFAYYAIYDKVMTQEEAEAEIAKLDALWEARKG